MRRCKRRYTVCTRAQSIFWFARNTEKHDHLHKHGLRCKKKTSTKISNSWSPVVLEANLSWSISPCKKSKILTESFHIYWGSKNPAIWLDKRDSWPHPTKIGSVRCYIPSMITSMQKSKITIDSFQKYWWSKNLVI